MSFPASRSAKPVYDISPSALHAFQFGELWQYRHLAFLLAWRHIRARYKQTVFGLLWAVIVPVAFTAIFVIFFKLVPTQPAGNLPYVPSAFAGMILWQLFTRGVSEGATSLTANAALITKVYFPRIVLPLAAVISALFDVLISLILLAGVLVWFQIPLQMPMLMAPLFVIQVALTVLAFSLWLSAIDGIFRDLRHALPLILQLGMFVSPVAYTTSAIVPQKWMWLYEYNPLVGPLEGFRWALLQGAPAVNISAELKSLVITAVLLVTGLLFFARMERTIVDRV
ncbi:ABC transporter permease [Streptomyces sp. AcH 505]|uniref:ABC transporter permease n=1 Tax=Streptomyces sp. AcH 505 TaxID=352211 RepID=UPI0012FF02DC